MRHTPTLRHATTAILAALTLTACTVPVPEGPETPPGRDMEVAVGRGGDRALVIVRPTDGAPLTRADEARALARARAVACAEGRTPYEDEVTLTEGTFEFVFFCAGILESEEIVILPV